MADTLNDVITELALANRILANEGVLDAFGHVSVRHPTRSEALFVVALALAAADRTR